MAGKLDEFIGLLAEDGEWHSLRELAEKLRLPDRLVGEIGRLFADYGFIQLDPAAGRAKIDPKLRRLILG